ncbi:MAG TPA: hypothetical protein VEA59_02030 [Patescibacteria group bacterium]|nr:hypothetical protein [Patescibacteria group bacterium]
MKRPNTRSALGLFVFNGGHTVLRGKTDDGYDDCAGKHNLAVCMFAHAQG